MGEHGDSEIATWSTTSIARMGIDEYCSKMFNNCNHDTEFKIYESVKNVAYEIIQKKGATFYTIALAIKRIVEAIIRDENSILTVSTLLEGQYGISDIYISVPSIIGVTGVKNVLEVSLSEDELKNLKNSAEKLKKIEARY